jgi:hypothetical protein
MADLARIFGVSLAIRRHPRLKASAGGSDAKLTPTAYPGPTQSSHCHKSIDGIGETAALNCRARIRF